MTFDDADFVTRGRRAWPSLHIDVEHVSEWLSRQPPPDALHFEDLYLAIGCAQRRPEALSIFESQLMPTITPLLRRLNLDPELVDEARQRLRQLLFAGNTPKIAKYSGKGSLVGWLRTVTLRVTLNLKESQSLGADRDDEALWELADMKGDLELVHIKTHSRHQFKAAFQDALAGLSARERTLLRLNVLDGLNISQIGALFQTHRSTIARWLAGARETLARDTRALLRERLRVSEAELDSLTGLVESQLDVSLSRLLTDVGGSG